MPVTKTAKRALRTSIRKRLVNKAISTKLEVAIRMAKRNPNEEKVRKAISLADRAAKKKVIHKRKAARIKSTLSKLLPKAWSVKPTTAKKTKTLKRKK